MPAQHANAADTAPRLCHDKLTPCCCSSTPRRRTPSAFSPPLPRPPPSPLRSALASSSEGCASSLPMPVHDAPALAPAAAPALPDNPAFSLGPGVPFCSPAPLGVPPPLGPGARGDVMLVFPRRLVLGDVSVIHPAAAPFAGGAARTPGLRPLPGTPPSGARIGRCPPPCPSCQCRSSPLGTLGPWP
jgi:hypothetical protein